MMMETKVRESLNRMHVICHLFLGFGLGLGLYCNSVISRLMNRIDYKFHCYTVIVMWDGE